MISTEARQRVHDALEELMDAVDAAANEAAANIGALKVCHAAEKLDVTPGQIHNLVRQGKLSNIGGLITYESIMKYLGTTPRARARAARRAAQG